MQAVKCSIEMNTKFGLLLPPPPQKKYDRLEPNLSTPKTDLLVNLYIIYIIV